MSPTIAACLTWAFVLFLLVRDWRRSPRTSPGLWIATVWLIVLATRAPHYWLSPTSGRVGVEAYEEGNAFNQVFYLGLMALGMLTLWRRDVEWGEVLRRNRALLIFFAYSVLSALWAENPLVSFKGSFKAVVGNLIMALVVLTDRNPIEAVKTVFLRLTYVAIPLSVMVIKYFPDIGRGTHRWQYYTMYSGIAVGSNGLATLCYMCGIIIVWYLVRRGALADRKQFGLNLLFLSMIMWLMLKADGATSVAALMVGVMAILFLSRESLRGYALLFARHIGIFLVVMAPLLILNYGFFIDAAEFVFGRSETLWGRLVVWQNAVSLVDRPLLGFGYNNFWQGERLAAMWEIYNWKPTQAHNGYIETYLNLGLVGVVLLMIAIIAGFRRAANPNLDSQIQNLKLPYMLPILFYNLTEAAFRGLHPVWFAFLLFAMETRGQLQGESSQVIEPVQPSRLEGHRNDARQVPRPSRWSARPQNGNAVARRAPFGRAPAPGSGTRL